MLSDLFAEAEPLYACRNETANLRNCGGSVNRLDYGSLRGGSSKSSPPRRNPNLVLGSRGQLVVVAPAPVLGHVVWTQHVIAKRARVRDFKSVTDSGEIRIDESVTCLVGKNESGKTAILEPLYRLNAAPTGHPETFVPLRDYPRSRYLRERDTAEEKSPIELTLEFEDADITAIEKVFGKSTLTSKEVTVFRHYNNAYALNAGINEGPSIKKMVEELRWLLDRPTSWLQVWPVPAGLVHRP